MAAYEASVESMKLKRENKILEPGLLGYTGGFAGFAQDTAAGIGFMAASQETGELLENLVDDRTAAEKLEDTLDQIDLSDAEALYNHPFFEDIRKTLQGGYDEQIKKMMETYLGSTAFTTYTPDGTKINYTIGDQTDFAIELDFSNLGNPNSLETAPADSTKP